MMTFNDLFEDKLKTLCAEAIAHETDIIVNGAPVQNLADYKHRCGVIAGLNRAIELCAEANKLLAEH